MRTSSGPESFLQHFSRFATAISVVGVSLLAFAGPLEAQIVYHSAHITIDDGVYNLDLNGDGVTDFTIDSHAEGKCSIPEDGGFGILSVTPSSSGNGAIVGPLTKGDEIGPDQGFAEGELQLAEYMIAEYPRGCGLDWTGPWFGANVNYVAKGYLGLSFQLNGETRYGWAELTVRVPIHLANGKPGVSATLTGYAYETTPGKAITASDKTGD